jgi:hypothetical protein
MRPRTNLRHPSHRPGGQPPRPLLVPARLGSTPDQLTAERHLAEEIELLAELIVRANEQPGQLRQDEIDVVFGLDRLDEGQAVA